MFYEDVYVHKGSKKFAKYFFLDKFLDKCAALVTILGNIDTDNIASARCAATYLHRYAPADIKNALNEVLDEVDFNMLIDNEISEEELNQVLDLELEKMHMPTLVSKCIKIPKFDSDSDSENETAKSEECSKISGLK